jgi:prolyl 4-hydroxylase
METFTPVWEEWIDQNLTLGNCKQIMFQKSLENGYSYNLLHKKLGIEYIIENKTHTEKIALRTAQKINARNLEIYTIDNFLTKEECDKIIQDINNSDLENSSTVSVEDPKERNISDYRTSQTCYFNNNTYIEEIESRICKEIGINNRFSEKIQGQKYVVGQEFKRHTDFFYKHILENDKTIQGQRTWTFMVYLNDVEEGGYTSFPYAFASINPKAGKAVIWNNLTNKVGNEFSSHCGMPIIQGEKYILTKWFKDTEINMNIRNEISDHHFLPIFHPIGFEKVSMTLPSVEAIKECMVDIHPAMLLENLTNECKHILTKWINYKAELIQTDICDKEYIYGSILENKYDKSTHVISAMIHIGHDIPWDLYIEDHSYRPHTITMKYGDILLYESTTCLHGRPIPFEGDSYRNIYVHFKPDKW